MYCKNEIKAQKSFRRGSNGAIDNYKSTSVSSSYPAVVMDVGQHKSDLRLTPIRRRLDKCSSILG